ncbi:MAG: FtsX-like permease family protein, partial [Thermoproteota archaeon]
MNSTINHINSKTEALGRLIDVGETYLIISRNSTSITDSKIDAGLTNLINDIAGVEYVLPQKIFKAILTTNSTNRAVLVRVVEDVSGFLRLRNAYVNGTIAKGREEVNTGEVLARTADIAPNTTIILSVNGKNVSFKVVGIYRTQSQLDGEILIPLTAIKNFTTVNSELSIIEFTLKPGIDRRSVLTSLAEKLPTSVQIIKIQQPGVFMQKVNMQTITFLNVWSIAVYAVIAVASYIITAHLTAESAYELAMLRALGAGKWRILILVVDYIVVVAILGSILGIALGVAGTQVASTLLRWLHPTMEVSPFLQAEQALNTIILTLASSVFGCAIPAYRSARIRYVEQPL